MCGICGVFGARSDAPSIRHLDLALDAMAHRGPDSKGRYVGRDGSMAMCRLAVLDVPGGDQPIYNQDRSIAVVFNGEIYNYRKLRDQLVKRGYRFQTSSDTEVLVHLWDSEREKMPELLRGMFAFSLYNSRSRTLFLARDRFGKKPLFYERGADGSIAYASDLRALRCLRGSSRPPWRIQPEAIYHYLSLA